jgi:regulator of CtrA degradation
VEALAVAKDLRDRAGDGDGTIAFSRAFAHSETFRALFREGMGLVEESAAYLDGDGRDASRGLSRGGSLAYAAESMRLTTRLMQIASWLLLQRAVAEGEMTPEQATRERAKVRLDDRGPAVIGAERAELPESLIDLITRSLRLQQRIRQLDRSFQNVKPEGGPNLVAEQLSRLTAAFPPTR